MRTVKLTKESTKDILENLLKRSPNNYGKFESTVAQILDKVKNEGDAALFAYTSCTSWSDPQSSGQYPSVS